MRLSTSASALTVSLAIVGLSGSVFAEPEPGQVVFNRDIRPLLSNNCFACHGPDEKKRKADFRLDTREGMFADLDGHRAVVAGDVAASALYERISTADKNDHMPPPDSGKSLTKDEIELIRRWIEQGAAYQEHWSYMAPARPPLPATRRGDWARSEIDHFILARLEREGLSPQSEADRITLIRRATFDLTGLPPTFAEVDAFLADPSPTAFETVVDRLLQSPHYGEHMARFWLDAARYGDTHGLHLDNYREMWPYRDWVVRAFNADMPFDRFTIEQLGGDLLPDATLDQQIATGFNRCNVSTNEGGSIKEEVYVRNVVDRVETTGTVFLGMTLGCAVCHGHKFDPVSQTEFYQMFAFFNNLDGPALDGNRKDPAPVVKIPTAEQTARIAELNESVAVLERRIKEHLAKIEYAEPEGAAKPKAASDKHADYVWIDDAVPAGAKAEGNSPWKFVNQPVHTGEKASTRTATGLSQHFFTGASTPLLVGKNDKLFAYVFLDPKNPPKEIMLQFNDGSWEHRAYWGDNRIDWGSDGSPSRRKIGPLPEPGKWVRLEVDPKQVGLEAGSRINGWAFTQFDGTVHWDTAGLHTKTLQGEPAFDTTSLAAWIESQRSLDKPKLPKPVVDAVKADPAKRSDEQKTRVKNHFLRYVYAETRKTFDPLNKQLDDAKKQRTDVQKSVVTSLVYKERDKPREAYLLTRGQYDQRSDKVTRKTPAVLPAMADDLPRNRLGLARWLVQPDHPLTARVAVNRFWLQVFGTGIVKTAEDFGSQGEPPSHPELLDYLATQFVVDGWDVKRFMKRIVLSATYRQSAKVTPELYQRDPENRLLARGPRFRLDAEMLRDQALAVSGLLVRTIGGPSVKPPQPDGLWFAVGYSGSNTVRFKRDDGEKVFRRALYTFIKRTSPPPSMGTFDAPSREACSVRRERTNTPLQALFLMNEPQSVEAARRLAERALAEGGDTAEAQARFAFRLCTARPPNADELADLLDALAAYRREYKQDPDAARQLIAVGDSKPDPARDAVELAAWTMIANIILNLDEVVTKG